MKKFGKGHKQRKGLKKEDFIKSFDSSFKSIANDTHSNTSFLSSYTTQHSYIVETSTGKGERCTGLVITDWISFFKDFFLIEFCAGSYIECVYMIGGFYIGSTGDLNGRLKSHIRKSINNNHNNKYLQSKIIECMDNGVSMPVSILSLNKKEERDLIKRYSHVYDLLNIDCNLKR